LRCHFILDQSASMYYPEVKSSLLSNLDKISFSALSIASIMQLLSKQRDAVGLSIYDEELRFQSAEKGSSSHFSMIYDQLEKVSSTPSSKYQNLHLSIFT